MKLSTGSHKALPFSESPIGAGFTAEYTDEHRLLDVNEMITNGREGYSAYPVTGTSMVDQIHPGNIVFVDTWAEPRNGSVVAALVNGQVCVKIFQNTALGLYLVSKNEDHEPRRITPKDSFYVLGVVRGHLALYQ